MKITIASILGEESVFHVDDGFVTYEGIPIGWIRKGELEVFVETQPVPKESDDIWTAETLDAAVESPDLPPPWEHAQHRMLLLRQVRTAMTPREPEPGAVATVHEEPHPLDRLKALEDKLAAAHARLDKLEKK